MRHGFCLWGGRRGWVQIGSAEDCAHVRRARMLVARRRLEKAAVAMVEPYARLGRTLKEIDARLTKAFVQIARASYVPVETVIRTGRKR